MRFNSPQNGMGHMKLQSTLINDTGEKAHSPNPGARKNVLVVPSSI